MSMKITGISCPQCGSADVKMVSDQLGVCNACGSQFALTPPEPEIPEEPDGLHFSVARIPPKYSKKDFLRRVWMSMEEKDAPLGVFDENFGEVKAFERQVLINKIEAVSSYQASIGYDRQETYTDYETYYEDEPYTDYETYYENGMQKRRPVTKTRKVEKQRAVTKTRTVTDWRPTSGTYQSPAIAIVDNSPNREDLPEFDEDLFTDMYKILDPEEDLTLPSPEEYETITLSEDVKREALSVCSHSLYRSTLRSLPGDQVEDFHATVAEIKDVSYAVYLVTEYEATITYNGVSYTKHAFACGDMTVAGDEIENDESLEDVLEQKKEESESLCRRKKHAMETAIRKKSLPITILLISLMTASCLVSLLLPYLAVMIPVFVAATVAFVAHIVLVKRYTDRETALYDKEIKEENARLEKELNSFQKNYRKTYRETLNRKLSSLGLASVK